MKVIVRVIRYLLISQTLFVSGRMVFAAEYKATDEKQFQEIVKKLQSSDIVILQNGERRNVNLVFKADGTSQKPIIFRAETKGKVQLTGASSMKIAGDFLIVDGFSFKNGGISEVSVIEFRESSKKESHYSRLTNTAIVDYNPIENANDNKWVSIYGDHNRVDHCFFKGKTNKGTTLVVWINDNPNHHSIDSNYFGERPTLGQNGGETIRVGTGLWATHISKTIIEHNLFEKCSGETEIISNKSCENTYRYNTFRDCEGTLTLRNGNRCLVDGNYFFGEHSDHAGGVRIIGENHVVINNYFQGLKGKDYFSSICIVNGIPGTEEGGIQPG